MKTFEEWWLETFKALDLNEKIALYNEFANENGYKEIFDFDEDFFNMFFEGKPCEAVRAWHFGGRNNNWSDNYITFNGYGNLETLTDDAAEEICNDHDQDIFNFGDYENYIDPADYDGYMKELEREEEEEEEE